MKSLRSRAFRMVAGLGAAGMLLVVGITAGPAYAEPADRGPTSSGYQVKPLVSRSGATFLPSDSGNPINSDGRVAGSTTVDEVSRAAVFSLRTKRMQVLSAFAGQRTEATDINDRGEVSGTVYPTSGGSRAFWWSTRTGRVRLLPLDGGLASVSIALNDRGVVLGSVQDPDWTPTIWNVRSGTDRRLTELDDAQAINNRGWVAGTALYVDDSRASKPMVWRFLKEITPELSPTPPAIQPVGASDSQNSITRYLTEVRFERLTPADAATKMTDEIKGMIAG